MFWERYSAICNNNGKSPNGVAKEIGLSTAICTKWKNGATPNSEALIKLANYFGITTDYLLGRSDDVGGSAAGDVDETTKNIIDICGKLSAVDKAKLLVYADGLLNK